MEAEGGLARFQWGDRRPRLSFSSVKKLLITLLFAAATASADEVLLRPAPSWVERATFDASTAVPNNDIRYGIFTLLDDHQVRVTETVADYQRKVRRVLTSGGVQNASELSIDFDPSYQNVVVHHVQLLRNGKTIDELPHASIRVIDKEDESSDRIYDGTRSALIILSDVRPGDIIDYDFSREGANPILGGKFADTFDLTTATPTHVIRHRLLWPVSRTLRYRNFVPKIETRGGERVYVWEQRDVPPIDVEDHIPDWFDPYTHVQLSEFASWSEVGQWATAMFHMGDASRATVHQLAQNIRASNPRDPVAAAIRFVQDDIRYLGIEMGRNSHEPHQPAEVLEQRWGDCKDKSFLLSALLRELGVEAYPALVSTRLRHELDTQLPSPFLFDHVITPVIAKGKVRWIDATLSDQGGALETIDTPSDERALVVRDGAHALTNIDIDPHATTLVEQTYTAQDYISPVTLDIVTTYRGGDADAFRSSLVSDSISDLARDHLNRYAADHPKIEVAGLPGIRDDRDRNVITLRERYRIRGLWKNGEWSYTAHAIAAHLQLPDRRIRTMPLAFDYPLDLTERMTLRLPDHLAIDEDHDEVETSAFRFESKVKSEGNAIVATYHIAGLRDGVPAAAVADHLIKLNDVNDSLTLSIDPERDAPLLTKVHRTLLRHVPAALLISLLVLLVPAGIFLRGRPRNPGNTLEE